MGGRQESGGIIYMYSHYECAGTLWAHDTISMLLSAVPVCVFEW